MSATVMLADGHDVYRRSLRALLDADAGLHVVAEARDGRAAPAIARVHRPDVIVVDLELPLLNGLELTKLLVADDPAIGVIVVSMHAGPRLADEALRAGARGYVAKDGPPADLVATIREVAAGCHREPEGPPD